MWGINMGIQQFLGYYLDKEQKVLSLMGPSGTGKSFSASFLQEFMGYKIARQITTRDPRPDDVHYNYMSREDFIRLERDGKILGVFAGDRESLQGNGYGYLCEELMDEISTDSRIILFPSAFELDKSDFIKQYGTTDKIGLAFKDSQSVRSRAEQCGKVLSENEVIARIRNAEMLTHLMEKYNRTNDPNFHLIYSDNPDETLSESKARQLKKIVSYLGQDSKEMESNIEEYISR